MHRFVKPETVEHSVAKKFKWGKVKDVPRQALSSSTSGASSSELGNSVGGGASGGGGVGVSRNGSVDMVNGVGKAHSFQQTSILRPVRCDYCGDKMWGLNEVRCTSELRDGVYLV